jgi:hypothetical protein
MAPLAAFVIVLFPPVTRMPFALGPEVVIVPELMKTLLSPAASMPTALSPVVLIVPSFVTMFPVEPVNSRMPCESAPLVTIVPVLRTTLLSPPSENMPSDRSPFVVIVPLLVIVLLLSKRMPSNVSPVTVMPPWLVTSLWSRTKIPLIFVTSSAASDWTITVTSVLPAAASTRVVSGLGAEASQVTVWPVAGSWLLHAASAGPVPKKAMVRPVEASKLNRRNWKCRCLFGSLSGAAAVSGMSLSTRPWAWHLIAFPPQISGIARDAVMRLHPPISCPPR